MTPPDRLDEAFADHFRSARPTTWPGPPTAALPQTKPQPAQSRLVLALAAAVLLGLSALISKPASPAPAVADPLLKQAEANGANLPKLPPPMP